MILEAKFTESNHELNGGASVSVVVTEGGGDASVIDDSIVSAETTWSSHKIATEIANIPSGGGVTEDDVVNIIDQQMEHIKASVIAALPVYDGSVV